MSEWQEIGGSPANDERAPDDPQRLQDALREMRRAAQQLVGAHHYWIQAARQFNKAMSLAEPLLPQQTVYKFATEWRMAVDTQDKPKTEEQP